MPELRVHLQEVDEIRATTVMDNSIDLLMANTEVAKRLPIAADSLERPLPIAEHGFAALITVREGDRWRRVLLDTGSSPTGVLHNLDAMSIDASEIEVIVLSHGHFDHTLGLPALLQRMGTGRVRVVLHPDAFLERRLVRPDAEPVRFPRLFRGSLEREGVEMTVTPDPTLLLDGTVLVSGEIERTTSFEVGFPPNQARRGESWEPDPLIHDDQCVIANLRGKGLVVVSGCAHAGIVNSVRHAQALTGVEAVHAVMGGFHLTGKLFEGIIPPTIAALREISPRYLVPTHCTGFAAIHEVARAFPDAFVANAVGTTLVFQGLPAARL